MLQIIYSCSIFQIGDLLLRKAQQIGRNKRKKYCTKLEKVEKMSIVKAYERTALFTWSYTQHRRDPLTVCPSSIGPFHIAITGGNEILPKSHQWYLYWMVTQK